MAPIHPDDWKRIETLFDGALDQPSETRDEWLVTQCGDDTALLARVRELLRAEGQSGALLGEPVAVVASELVSAGLADPMRGRELGPYQLMEEIGHGGMGVVYRAERRDGEFDKDVVVKVLRAGMDARDALRRFRQERQILADLDHPHVARLIDGGVTEDERPYIVMEHVRGTRIDLYCDGHRLGVRQRLELYLDVIDAVDYAHRNLVIHRDIKPSNVLVTEEHQVKLLDFGIAKILDEGESGVTVTRLGAMTPEYASPEQIQQTTMTTASDVYQLGVLLYEILTGQGPYELSSTSPMEVGRTICEVEPTAPSRAVTRHPASRTTAGPKNRDPAFISEARGTSVAKLRRALDGDLDRILLMALRKEPERRYASARQLGDDIRRHLEGQPVLARGSSAGYRLGKFARRNWLSVAGATTTIVLLAAFGIFHTLRVTAARARAEREAAQREEISEFLVDLFRVSEESRSSGDQVTARELLERGRRRIDEDLSEPDVRARMLDVVGEVNYNLGLVEPARTTLEEALALNAEVYGDRSQETAGTLHRLGSVYKLDRQFDRAVPLLEQALSIRRELLPADDLEIAHTLSTLATARRDLGEVEEAEREMREAMAILDRKLPPDDSSVITARANLAYVLRGQGKNDEAEALYREVVRQMRRREDADPQTMAGILNNLAYLLRLRESYEEAEQLYQEAVARSTEALGEAHPTTLLFRQNLASAVEFAGKHEETLHHLREIARLRESMHGADHWRVGSAKKVVALFLLGLGRPAEAEPQIVEATRVLREGLGVDHPWTADTEMILAAVRTLQGRATEAQELLSHAEPIVLSEESRGNGSIPVTLSRLMTVYDEAGFPERSARCRELLRHFEEQPEG